MPQGHITECSILKTALPFGQQGISIQDGIIYLTLPNGIYTLTNHKLTLSYPINHPQNRCIVSKDDGRLIFIRGGVLSLAPNGELAAVTKRQAGNCRLFAFEDQINLFSNGSTFCGPERPTKIIRDILSDNPTETVYEYPTMHGTDACIVDDKRHAIIGTIGLRFYENNTEVWRIEVTNGSAIEHHNGRLYFLESGVHLQSVDLSGQDRRSIARFLTTDGSAGDFAISAEGEIYLHLCYHKDGTANTCLIRLKA